MSTPFWVYTVWGEFYDRNVRNDYVGMSGNAGGYRDWAFVEALGHALTVVFSTL